MYAWNDALIIAGALLVMIIAQALVLQRIMKKCGDSERFAVFRGGQFVNLKGPGNVLVLPLIMNVISIEKGDGGELVSDTEANIKGILLPVRIRGHAEPGARIRIVEFEADRFSQRLVVKR